MFNFCTILARLLQQSAPLVTLVPFRPALGACKVAELWSAIMGDKIALTEINKNKPFLIGPEGDFSRLEVEFAIKNGYSAVRMSDFRLRTETAALTAVFSLNYNF